MLSMPTTIQIFSKFLTTANYISISNSPSLSGEAKSRFVASAGLADLSDRLNGIDEHAARDLDSALLHLDDDTPLNLLYANELGASGMYGLRDDRFGISKMTFALLSHNV